MPRPDKKSGAKKQMKGMEDLLRSIAGNTGLRKHCDFVKFLMPDDQFGRFTEGDHSEVVCHLSHTAWVHNVHVHTVQAMEQYCMGTCICVYCVFSCVSFYIIRILIIIMPTWNFKLRCNWWSFLAT